MQVFVFTFIRKLEKDIQIYDVTDGLGGIRHVTTLETAITIATTSDVTGWAACECRCGLNCTWTYIIVYYLWKLTCKQIFYVFVWNLVCALLFLLFVTWPLEHPLSRRWRHLCWATDSVIDFVLLISCYWPEYFKGSTGETGIFVFCGRQSIYIDQVRFCLQCTFIIEHHVKRTMSMNTQARIFWMAYYILGVAVFSSV